MRKSVLMATDMIRRVQHSSSIIRDERRGRCSSVAGCRSKSDASVTLGSRRVAEEVKSLVDVPTRGDSQMCCPSTATSDIC